MIEVPLPKNNDIEEKNKLRLSQSIKEIRKASNKDCLLKMRRRKLERLHEIRSSHFEQLRSKRLHAAKVKLKERGNMDNLKTMLTSIRKDYSTYSLF